MKKKNISVQVHVAIDTGDLASTLVDYQASYYKVVTSLKCII